MNNHNLSVREIQPADVERITEYWLNSEPEFLQGMGVDITKLPTKVQLSQMLQAQIISPLEEKQSYCMIWEVAGEPVGHCNTNPVHYGEEACMHLHLWWAATRQQGIGTELVRLTLPFFFTNLQLKKLYCEPYALNEAPNKTLRKLGFELVKQYTTIPGSLSFEQPVNRWELTYQQYQQLTR